MLIEFKKGARKRWFQTEKRNLVRSEYIVFGEINKCSNDIRLFYIRDV
jgi:hypothetical protein